MFQKRKDVEERKLTIENALKWEKFRTLRGKVKITRDEERKLESRNWKLKKPLSQSF